MQSRKAGSRGLVASDTAPETAVSLDRAVSTEVGTRVAAMRRFPRREPESLAGCKTVSHGVDGRNKSAPLFEAELERHRLLAGVGHLERDRHRGPGRDPCRAFLRVGDVFGGTEAA